MRKLIEFATVDCINFIVVSLFLGLVITAFFSGVSEVISACRGEEPSND